jgi:hypothetical protein
LEHFRENYYRLDPIDKKPRNDWNERLDRGNFRLHPGRISEGCITLDDDYENPNEIWKKLKKIIDGTSTIEVDDNYKGKTALITDAWTAAHGAIIPRKLKKYGELIVTDNSPQQKFVDFRLSL